MRGSLQFFIFDPLTYGFNCSILRRSLGPIRDDEIDEDRERKCAEDYREPCQPTHPNRPFERVSAQRANDMRGSTVSTSA